VSIFFDLQKVYDTTWKYGILKDLFDMGLKGKLPTFMNSRNHTTRALVILSMVLHMQLVRAIADSLTVRNGLYQVL
jgi:hypothetical protein